MIESLAKLVVRSRADLAPAPQRKGFVLLGAAGDGMTARFGRSAFTVTRGGEAQRIVECLLRRSPLLYAPASRIAKAASGVPWTVRTLSDRAEDDGDWRAQLLEYPNPGQSRKFLMEMASLQLLLTGNAIFLKNPDPLAKGRTSELYLLSSVYVRPETRQGRLVGYRDSSGLISGLIDPALILHVMFPNPADPFWGLGPGEVVKVLAEGEVEMNEFNLDLVKNNLVAPGAIKDSSIIDDDQLKAARAKLRKRLAETRTEPLILGKDADWIDMAQSTEEIGYIEGRKQGLVEACAVFGLSPALLAPDAATYSNYKTALRDMYRNPVKWTLDSFADAFDTNLLSKEERRRIEIIADIESVPEARADLVERVDGMGKAINAAIPPNEAAALFEVPLREPIPGGDAPLVPGNLTSLAEVVGPPGRDVTAL